MPLDLLDDDLAGLAGSILTAIMGDDADVDLAPVGLAPAGDAVTACVHITGGWQGSVTVVLPAELAGAVAAAMFDVAPAELSPEEVRDAVGELANIAGGNVKGVLDAVCELSLPIVAEASVDGLSFPGTCLARSVVLAHQGRPFALQIHERA